MAATASVSRENVLIGSGDDFADVDVVGSRLRECGGGSHPLSELSRRMLRRAQGTHGVRVFVGLEMPGGGCGKVLGDRNQSIGELILPAVTGPSRVHPGLTIVQWLQDMACRYFLKGRRANQPLTSVIAGMTLPDEIAAQRTNMMRYAWTLTRNRDDAEDLVQEALCRALRHSCLYEPGTNLRAWLFTILHNEHVNRTRASLRRGSEVEVDKIAFLLPAAGSSDSRRDFVEAMRALVRLPKDMATVLLLVMEGRDYDEIASLTKAPLGTVRSRLCRGRAALREALQW
jgi:RNA polymerase sigma-70 factor, ECF subfamily